MMRVGRCIQGLDARQVLVLCLKSGLAWSFASYFSLGHASEGWRQQLSSSLDEPLQGLKCYAEGWALSYSTR